MSVPRLSHHFRHAVCFPSFLLPAVISPETLLLVLAVIPYVPKSSHAMELVVTYVRDILLVRWNLFQSLEVIELEFFWPIAPSCK